MIVHAQHQVKQFGLPDATEQLSLFRLWLCENFILQVSQREIKNSFIFKTLFKYLVPSIVYILLLKCSFKYCKTPNLTL